jgi:hypothetical protein
MREARLGRIGLDEWLRRSQTGSLIPHPLSHSSAVEAAVAASAVSCFLGFCFPDICLPGF